MQKRRYNWPEILADFKKKLEQAVPEDLKGYVGLIDAKGNCDFCCQKKVLFVDRTTKKAFCEDCRPIGGYEYTTIEYNDMWQLAQNILFYANETIKEMADTSKKSVYEGWVDVEEQRSNPDIPLNYLTGLFITKTGASNIANVERELKILNGHKVRVTVEVLDVPENRLPSEKIPRPKKGEDEGDGDLHLNQGCIPESFEIGTISFNKIF